MTPPFQKKKTCIVAKQLLFLVHNCKHNNCYIGDGSKFHTITTVYYYLYSQALLHIIGVY